jgi:hypothetical protein
MSWAIVAPTSILASRSGECIIKRMITIRLLATIISLVFLLISGCNLEQVEATSTQLATTAFDAQAPTVERDFQIVSNPTDVPSATTETCNPNSDALDKHIVVADVDYAMHTANVQQQIHITNKSENQLEQIVLNVESNYYGIFALEQITIDQVEPDYTLDGKQLTIDLSDAILPGCEVVIALDFWLRIPVIEDEGRGFLGYTRRQLNLGQWLATVAVMQDDEWISHEVSNVGEHDILNQADWDVTVNLITPPDGLFIAAPGIVTNIDDGVWRFEHNASRDFTMSFSDKFNLSTKMTSSGVMVEVYSFNNAQNNGAAAQALDVATRSMEMYGDLFGAYPYSRVIVVQGDFPDGMEFSGLVFVGNYWFSRYKDDPASYLTLITVHEISHQWWYAKVGNDSAYYPWLDESLATYSEYIFLEEYYPDLRDWWWEFRVLTYSPQGLVDSTIYEFNSNRAYINAVYLRGAQMLHDLRGDLGTDIFFQWIEAYAQAGTGQMATPELFWSLLTTEQLEATQETRDLYLGDPLPGDE